MSDEKVIEQQFTVRMPKESHRELKLLCVSEGLVMNDVINEAVAQWVRAFKESKAKAAEKQESGEAAH